MLLHLVSLSVNYFVFFLVCSFVCLSSWVFPHLYPLERPNKLVIKFRKFEAWSSSTRSLGYQQFKIICCLHHPESLKMDTAGSPKTRLLTYQTTRSHITEDHNLDTHCHDNLKFHKSYQHLYCGKDTQNKTWYELLSHMK
jgi:hypothetical protein